ncbi:MAG: hypothetical protein HW421_2761 [Ignavibacteria bacterium]|nr:hypothetical protein [Ignavibacteria bacterium]
MKRDSLLVHLFETISSADKAMVVLRKTYDDCIKINPDIKYSDSELVLFEALTSRFARACDLLTQKVMKTTIQVLGEDLKTFIDIANFFEKIEVLESADDLLEIRRIRNSIAHEYMEEKVEQLITEVLILTPKLFEIYESTKLYIEKKFGKIND